MVASDNESETLSAGVLGAGVGFGSVSSFGGVVRVCP